MPTASRTERRIRVSDTVSRNAILTRSTKHASLVQVGIDVDVQVEIILVASQSRRSLDFRFPIAAGKEVFPANLARRLVDRVMPHGVPLDRSAGTFQVNVA